MIYKIAGNECNCFKNFLKLRTKAVIIYSIFNPAARCRSEFWLCARGSEIRSELYDRKHAWRMKQWGNHFPKGF